MKLFFEKVHLYLKGSNRFGLITLFIIANALNSLLFYKLSYFITGAGLKNNAVDHLGEAKQFLYAVVLAPLLETLVFQYALIESLRQKIKPQYVCLISAASFALVHCYSIYYFLFALMSGMIFAYLYYLEKSAMKGFILVLSAHFLYNLLTYMGRFL